MADPNKIRKLLAARRTFDVKPLPESGVMADVARGKFDGLQRHGFYIPEHLIEKARLPRPTAFYDAPLPNARAIRRHEAMHGVFQAALDNPELADVVPLWSRLRGGAFEDELLARLASKDPGSILTWPAAKYRDTDPVAYAVASPVLRGARFVSEHPTATGAAVTTLGGLAYGAMAPDAPPEDTEIADEFDRQVFRQRRPSGY